MIRDTVVLAIAAGTARVPRLEQPRALRRGSCSTTFPGNGTPAAEAIASRQLVRSSDISEDRGINLEQRIAA